MAGVGRSGRGRGQPAVTGDADPAMNEGGSDVDDETLEVGWWPGWTTTPAWLRNTLSLVGGVLTGIAVTAGCVFALAPVLWYLALVVGPIVAVMIWAVTAAALRRGNGHPARLWFLAGFGAIPWFYAIVVFVSILTG